MNVKQMCGLEDARWCHRHLFLPAVPVLQAAVERGRRGARDRM